jgi:glycosyltransferase involved in cell wall biosynthesis
MVFSIVIPVYNREDYLKSALKSALMQNDFFDYEIIVVDDGSKIELKPVIDLFQINSKIKINYFKIENSGPGLARNFGVTKAQGKYIVFLDSDDLLYQGALHVYKKMIESHDFSAFITLRSNQLNEQIDTEIYLVQNQKLEYCAYKSYLYKKSNPEFGASNIVVKKKCFDEVGGFDRPRNRSFHLEDHDLLLKLAKFSNFGIIFQPKTVVYRIHESNSINEIEKILIGINNLTEKYKNNEYESKKISRFRTRAIIGIPVFHWSIKLLKQKMFKKGFKLMFTDFVMILSFIVVFLPIKLNLSKNERKSI